MEMIESFLDFVLHLNKALPGLFNDYGMWFYAILFLIIFVETGLVVMPFLPGDSLLFAAGALCAGQNNLSLTILLVLLIPAAILGDQCNYFIGRFFGSKIVAMKFRGKPLIAPKHLNKTEDFFTKHGTKAIIMARFVPIVRTITPFVAGVGKMDYRKKFLPYDILGGVLWIVSMTLAGFFLGQIEFVQEHFETVVILIILISLAPIAFAYLKSKFGSKA
jgi:membrane-associated protein